MTGNKCNKNNGLSAKKSSTDFMLKYSPELGYRFFHTYSFKKLFVFLKPSFTMTVFIPYLFHVSHGFFQTGELLFYHDIYKSCRR